MHDGVEQLRKLVGVVAAEVTLLLLWRILLLPLLILYACPLSFSHVGCVPACSCGCWYRPGRKSRCS